MSLNIRRTKIKASTEEKLLGMVLDKKLCFILQVMSKRPVKGYMHSRILYLLDIDQLKLTRKAFMSYPSATSVLLFECYATEHMKPKQLTEQ